MFRDCLIAYCVELLAWLFVSGCLWRYELFVCLLGMSYVFCSLESLLGYTLIVLVLYRFFCFSFNLMKAVIVCYWVLPIVLLWWRFVLRATLLFLVLIISVAFALIFLFGVLLGLVDYLLLRDCWFVLNLWLLSGNMSGLVCVCCSHRVVCCCGCICFVRDCVFAC